MISDGYLFTVKDQRPVVVPFKLSDPEHVATLDQLLASHATTCHQLMQSVVEQWPYDFGPQQDIQKDVDRFVRRQVVLLRGGEEVLIQNPGNNTPILTPDGIDGLMPLLEGRKNMFPATSWLLPPDYDAHIHAADIRAQLTTAASANQLDKLIRFLPDLCVAW